MLCRERLLSMLVRGARVGIVLCGLCGPGFTADPPGKTPFAALDRDGSGTLSLDESLASPAAADKNVARRNFGVVDFDRNGTLSEEEFRAWPGLLPIDQRGPIPDPVADLAAETLQAWQALLKEADRDQDGTLSAAEWPQGAAWSKFPSAFSELKFEQWDADRSGGVEDAEAGRLIGIAYGTVLPDGTPARSANGRVLFLSWIQSADRNGDHAISRSEFVTSYWLTPPDRTKLFEGFDKDGNGALSGGEMLASPGLNVDGLSLFLHLDKDLDGLLSAAEVFGNPSTGATKPHVAHTLAACDDDRDGKLSLREFQLAPAGLGYVTWRLFDRRDQDRDGFLGWKEFYTEKSPYLIGLAAELFRRFDRDRDGRLGLDEFEFAVDLMNVPVEILFRCKDLDRDGKLVLTEVFTRSEPAAGRDPYDLELYRVRRTRAADKFARDDANADGALDLAEYTAARAAAARESQETPGEYSTRLFIADSDGSHMRQLTDLPEFQKQGSPSWSADGQFIAFDGWKPQKGESFSSAQVVVVQADGQNPRILAEGAMPSFSPRGHRVAFSGPRTGGIWVASIQGTDHELVQIDDRGWGTDWSPDGRLVYANNVGRGANLAVVNIVEGQTELLFDEGESPYQQISWNMAWSPDGKRIAFKGVTKEGKEELGIVDARGASFGFIRRFEGPMLASFAWSPIENRILFVRLDPETRLHQVFFVDPDTKDPPRLLPGLDELRGYSDVAYSPDGKKIVVSCHRRTSPE